MFENVEEPRGIIVCLNSLNPGKILVTCRRNSAYYSWREIGPASATPRGVPQTPPKGPTRKPNQEQPSNKNNSSFNFQHLEISVPDWMEVMFFRIIMEDSSALLLCHVPPSVNILTTYKLNVIVGDLNQHLVMHASDDLLGVHGLQNHVDFPTHILGGSLDPVLSDLGEAVICKPLQTIGSSDHIAVSTHVNIRPHTQESYEREIWNWRHADWAAIQQSLRNTDWQESLTGDANAQIEWLTQYFLSLQREYVPHHSYTVRPTDQPWFGYRCQPASDAKFKAWRRLKQHPSCHNKTLHREACRHMRETSQWAISRWERDIQTRMRRTNVGSKQWWSLVKEKQGQLKQDTIPPLQDVDSSYAVTSAQKADLLVRQFSAKMQVDSPEKVPPLPRQITKASLHTLHIQANRVKIILKNLDTNKAVGPDISPFFVKKCAVELATQLAMAFNCCLKEKSCPRIWKHARVVPVHKKCSKSDPRNYRPISLLSILSKVFERIIADHIENFFDQNHLISDRQHGFRKKKSTSDVLMSLSQSWSDALDTGRNTIVIVLTLPELSTGSAYADYCTLSVSYKREESQAAIAQVNTALELIETWGHDGNPHLQQKSLKLWSSHVPPKPRSASTGK
nr:uncharacterized protein LOC113813281 [Penaeus vannamei]